MSEFVFESVGIARLLNQSRLAVPPNQRSYAWEEEHVEALLDDFEQALTNKEENYFLGTIVLVRTDPAEPSIVDGQQRLATTSIILARIRDRLYALGRVPSSQAVDREYLRQHDIVADREVPRLRLNTEDHDFYINRILRAPFDQAQPDRGAAPTDQLRASNVRLQQAAGVVDKFLDKLLSSTAKQAPSRCSRKVGRVSCQRHSRHGRQRS